MKLYSIRPLVFCLSVFMSQVALAQTTLSAQDKKDAKTDSETKTLFKGGPSPKIKSIGLSFSPLVQFGQLGPQQGGALALHVNNKWEIGASFLGSMRHRNEFYSNDLRQNFSAFSLAYTPNANKLVHLSFPLLIGVIRYQDASMMTGMPGPGGRFDNFYWRNGRNAFGLQPGINAELNVHKYIRLFAGANYRLAIGNDEIPELSGFSGQVGLKVGFFNHKISPKK